jgi:MFS family permease
MTVSTTLIGDYFVGHGRAKMMSLHTTFAAVSAFVLNIVGGMLGAHGWRTPYAVYAISLLLAAMMAIYLWEPDTGGGEASARHGSNHGPLQVRQLLLTCLIAALVGVAFLTVPVHLGYLFRLLHVVSSEQVGFAYALNSLGVILGSLAFGWLVGPRLKSVPLQLAAATGVLALSFIGMWLSRDYASLTITAAVNGIGMGLILPAVNTWNMRELPVSRRGLGVGAFQSSLFLGMFCNPILVVSLDGWSGSRAASVGWIGMTLMAAACLAAALGSRTKRAA